MESCEETLNEFSKFLDKFTNYMPFKDLTVEDTKTPEQRRNEFYIVGGTDYEQFQY